MNSLSWFIYLSGLAESMKPTFAILGGLALSAYALWWAVHWVSAEDYHPVRKPTKHFFVLGTILVSVVVIVPNGSTMRLIAASEYGERIANSERVKGIVDPGLQYVERWLKDQLKEKK